MGQKWLKVGKSGCDRNSHRTIGMIFFLLRKKSGFNFRYRPEESGQNWLKAAESGCDGSSYQTKALTFFFKVSNFRC